MTEEEIKAKIEKKIKPIFYTGMTVGFIAGAIWAALTYWYILQII